MMFLPMLAENCLGDYELNKKVVFEAKNLCINAVRDDGSELPIVKDANFKVRDFSSIVSKGEMQLFRY